MINKLQEVPLGGVDFTNREEQIKSCHYGKLDTTSNCYKIINKKNKVLTTDKVCGATLYYVGGMDCTTLCCQSWTY